MKFRQDLGEDSLYVSTATHPDVGGRNGRLNPHGDPQENLVQIFTRRCIVPLSASLMGNAMSIAPLL